MKLKEANGAESLQKRMFLRFFLGMIVLMNKTSDPIMAHLNKRGVLTSYWVVNDDDEIEKVISTT